jgi:hypothetical protein
MTLILTILLTATPNDYSCTTDLDCECKIVPYEFPNNSAECLEYRSEQSDDESEGDQ